MADAEIEAMGKVVDALGNLEEEERGRVLRWAAERYGVTVPKLHVDQDNQVDEDYEDDLDNGGEVDESRGGGAQSLKFEDFAELYDAVGPQTDPERVVVASYWTQIHQNKATFGSQELNILLKNLGHGVGTINKAMTANINKKPALILQITRGGSTQQARKKYKLTEAGKKWVLARLA
jgi:hypothetical protein